MLLVGGVGGWGGRKRWTGRSEVVEDGGGG
jgi:hypothetical protein